MFRLLPIGGMPGTFPILRVFFHMTAHRSEILSKSALSFLIRALGVGMSFALSVTVARKFGVLESGLFALGMTISAVACGVSRLGADNAVVRFTATLAAEQDYSAIQEIYCKVTLTVAIVAASVSFLLFWGADFVSVYLFRKVELTGVLRGFSLSILPLAMVVLHAEFLRGMRRISWSALVQFVIVPISAVVLTLATSSDAGDAARAYAIGTVLAAAIGAQLWRYALRPMVSTVRQPRSSIRFFGVARSLFVVSLCDLVVLWAPILLLGVWASSDEVGVFNAAYRTGMLVGFVLFAVNAISAPKFAGMYQVGDQPGLRDAARFSAKLTFVLALPIIAIFLAFPEEVLRAFGPGFEVGASMLVILAIGQFVNVVTGSVGYLLVMSGNEKILRNVSLASAAAQIGLCCALIPIFGGLGAAISATCVVVGSNIALTVFVRAKLGFVPLIGSASAPLPR